MSAEQERANLISAFDSLLAAEAAAADAGNAPAAAGSAGNDARLAAADDAMDEDFEAELNAELAGDAGMASNAAEPAASQWRVTTLDAGAAAPAGMSWLVLSHARHCAPLSSLY